jgi:hypothetical protein
MILAAGGDIGGARCLLAVIEWLLQNGESVILADHGFVRGEPLEASYGVLRRLPDSFEAAAELIRAKKIWLFFFSTSVKDAFALKLARLARGAGITVVCVLDSWMNARWRLEIDGESALIPDVYAVMDQQAYQNAVSLDGLPRKCLRITGQPALAELAHAWKNWKATDTKRFFENFHFDLDRKLIVFVSEPVEDDHGKDHRSASYRGYTEKAVLRALVSLLRPFRNRVQVGLLPHPRQNSHDLISFWEDHRKDVMGGLIRLPNGRQAVLAADGVCGMASILLYEAWLTGKPVLSLQPGLRRKDFLILQQKPGVHHVVEKNVTREAVAGWMEAVLNETPSIPSRNDLKRHQKAPEKIGRLISSFKRQASGR